ncbi:unnamed protein product, partial [marine sediment metagenome]
GDTLTQANSDMSMIIDFIDSTGRYIYGYTTTTGTWDVTAARNLTIVQADDSLTAPDPNPLNINLNAKTDPPFGYDWTVYPTIDTKTYGTIPAKAYLGCLFNGRCVLAANPNSPHQWYMSRQANPYDWAYFANDAQSPVSGGDDDPGEIGDIIRALIPFDSDRLIFGCANSTMQLRGDPTFGGVLGTLDDNVGIFGSHSFCFDGDGNLYFWGTGG